MLIPRMFKKSDLPRFSRIRTRKRNPHRRVIGSGGWLDCETLETRTPLAAGLNAAFQPLAGPDLVELNFYTAAAPAVVDSATLDLTGAFPTLSAPSAITTGTAPTTALPSTQDLDGLPALPTNSGGVNANATSGDGSVSNSALATLPLRSPSQSTADAAANNTLFGAFATGRKALASNRPHNPASPALRALRAISTDRAR